MTVRRWSWRVTAPKSRTRFHVVFSANNGHYLTECMKSSQSPILWPQSAQCGQVLLSTSSEIFVVCTWIEFLSWDSVVDRTTNLRVEWPRNLSIRNRGKARFSPHQVQTGFRHSESLLKVSSFGTYAVGVWGLTTRLRLGSRLRVRDPMCLIRPYDMQRYSFHI